MIAMLIISSLMSLAFRLDLTEAEQTGFYQNLPGNKKQFPNLHIILASYFECYGQNLQTALSLPVQTFTWIWYVAPHS